MWFPHIAIDLVFVLDVTIKITATRCPLLYLSGVPPHPRVIDLVSMLGLKIFREQLLGFKSS